MIACAQAPIRIGIAGGGTDLPAWTREHVGRCLSLAVKTYAYAVAIARPDGQAVASYRQLDVASSATEIANGLIRESALAHGFYDGFEVHTLSEVSSRGTGLGVSSSIAVALAACFAHLAELRASALSERMTDGSIVTAERERIACDAWRVEIDRLRRPIGRQDHMAAAHGGLRIYAFEGDEARIERTFSEEDAAWVAAHLALLRLPDGHDARSILAGVARAEQVQVAAEAVPVAVRAIEGRDASLLGRALEMGQSSKLSIPGAVPPHVAALVARIHGAGVYGCKIAGAGGGGHLVVACDPSAVAKVAATVGLSVQSVVPDLTGVRCVGWR
mgnify:CR=1 FL=1